MSQRAVWPIPRIQTRLTHLTTSRSNWPTRIPRRHCSTPSQVMSWARSGTERIPGCESPSEASRPRRWRSVRWRRRCWSPPTSRTPRAGTHSRPEWLTQVLSRPSCPPPNLPPQFHLLPHCRHPRPKTSRWQRQLRSRHRPHHAAPTVQKRAPVVQVQQPVPSRVIAEPTPVAVEKPLPAAPIAVEPEPVAALPIPAPAVAPPPLIFTPPSPPALSAPPIFPAPAAYPAAPTPTVASSPWIPPWLRFGAPSAGQQTSQPAQWPQHPWPGLHNLWPRQQAPQPQLTPQVPQWTPAQVPQSMPSLVPQQTPSLVPQWTPAPVIPQWRPAPSAQLPQIPAMSPSPYSYPMLPGPSNSSGTYLLPPVGLDPTAGGF